MTKYQLKVILKSGDKVKVIGTHFKRQPAFGKTGTVRLIERVEEWCNVEVKGIPEPLRCLPEDIDFIDLEKAK